MAVPGGDSHIKSTGLLVGKDPVLWVWLEVLILKLYIKRIMSHVIFVSAQYPKRYHKSSCALDLLRLSTL